MIANAAKATLLFVPLFLSAALASPTEAAQNMLAAGRADDAISALTQQISSAPQDAEAYNLLCRAYYSFGNWDAGISACEKAVALQGDNSGYHLWLARAYGEKADSSNFLVAAPLAKKVRTEFERAVQLSPDRIDARTDLAEFYLEAPAIVGGGEDKARAQADVLARLAPAKAHWVNGRIAEKQKDPARAESEYRAAIAVTQGDAESWLNLALFFRHVGRLDDMEAAVQHTSLAPLRQPDALVDGADTLIRGGRNFPLAIQLLQRYLDSGGTVEAAPAFRAHYLLGSVFEKQGDKSAAAAHYRAALALAKNYARARAGLERVSK
jgi:tetratricopeptide (TPR) repeat protein